MLAYDDAFEAAVHFADGAKGSGSSSPTTVIRYLKRTNAPRHNIGHNNYTNYTTTSATNYHLLHPSPHSSQRRRPQHRRLHPRRPALRLCPHGVSHVTCHVTLFARGPLLLPPLRLGCLDAQQVVQQQQQRRRRRHRRQQMYLIILLDSGAAAAASSRQRAVGGNGRHFAAPSRI